VRSKYQQSETFLLSKLSKVEGENRDLKETVSKREIEIEIMKRQLREAMNLRMELSVENQRLKNEIEKSEYDMSTQRSQTMPDETQSAS
jgi:regulator of replication initiation timing